MTISCLQGAKTLVQLSEGKLTHLQIQKILYLSHMLFVGKRGIDSPLVRNRFLVWEYGPVARVVFDRLKRYSSAPVPEQEFEDIVSIIGNDKNPKESKYEPHASILKDGYKRWGEFKPFTLIAITHWKEGAWAKSLKRKEIEIDNSLVLEEYHARYRR